jgi:hypothetical protein
MAKSGLIAVVLQQTYNACHSRNSALPWSYLHLQTITITWDDLTPETHTNMRGTQNLLYAHRIIKVYENFLIWFRHSPYNEVFAYLTNAKGFVKVL